MAAKPGLHLEDVYKRQGCKHAADQRLRANMLGRYCFGINSEIQMHRFPDVYKRQVLSVVMLLILISLMEFLLLAVFAAESIHQYRN